MWFHICSRAFTAVSYSSSFPWGFATFIPPLFQCTWMCARGWSTDGSLAMSCPWASGVKRVASGWRRYGTTQKPWTWPKCSNWMGLGAISLGEGCVCVLCSGRESECILSDQTIDWQRLWRLTNMSILLYVSQPFWKLNWRQESNPAKLLGRTVVISDLGKLRDIVSDPPYLLPQVRWHWRPHVPLDVAWIPLFIRTILGSCITSISFLNDWEFMFSCVKPWRSEKVHVALITLTNAMMRLKPQMFNLKSPNFSGLAKHHNL